MPNQLTPEQLRAHVERERLPTIPTPTKPPTTEEASKLKADVEVIKRQIQSASPTTQYQIKDTTYSQPQALELIQTQQQSIDSYMRERRDLTNYLTQLKSKGFNIYEDPTTGEIDISNPPGMDEREAIYWRVELAPETYTFTITQNNKQTKISQDQASLKLKEGYNIVQTKENLRKKSQQPWWTPDFWEYVGFQLGTLARDPFGTTGRFILGEVTKVSPIVIGPKESEKWRKAVYEEQLETSAQTKRAIDLAIRKGDTTTLGNLVQQGILQWGLIAATLYVAPAIQTSLTTALTTKVGTTITIPLTGKSVATATAVKTAMSLPIAGYVSYSLYDTINILSHIDQEITKIKEEYNIKIKESKNEHQKQILTKQLHNQIASQEKLKEQAIISFGTLVAFIFGAYTTGKILGKVPKAFKKKLHITAEPGKAQVTFRKYRFHPSLKYGKALKITKTPKGYKAKLYKPHKFKTPKTRMAPAQAEWFRQHYASKGKPWYGPSDIPRLPKYTATRTDYLSFKPTPKTFTYKWKGKTFIDSSYDKFWQPKIKKHAISTKVHPKPKIYEPHLKFFSPLATGAMPWETKPIVQLTKPKPKIITMKDLYKKGILTKPKGPTTISGTKQQLLQLTKQITKQKTKIKQQTQQLQKAQSQSLKLQQTIKQLKKQTKLTTQKQSQLQSLKQKQSQLTKQIYVFATTQSQSQQLLKAILYAQSQLQSQLQSLSFKQTQAQLQSKAFAYKHLTTTKHITKYPPVPLKTKPKQPKPKPKRSYHVSVKKTHSSPWKRITKKPFDIMSALGFGAKFVDHTTTTYFKLTPTTQTPISSPDSQYWSTLQHKYTKTSTLTYKEKPKYQHDFDIPTKQYIKKQPKTPKQIKMKPQTPISHPKPFHPPKYIFKPKKIVYKPFKWRK